MPAQKRSHESSPSPPPHPEEEEEEEEEEMDGDDSQQQQLDQNNHSEEGEDTADSDESDSSSDEEKDEFVLVKLSDVRKEVQCPICLGIIRKTRTVMECLHRFCRECIDKSMRLGNNECPACRTHCASRRSLRDDPTYDALIAVLYPDIDKYEEEEFAFHEDEKARNKQIQASIAETLRRQSEALGRKKTGKATTAAYLRRSQGISYRHARGRRTPRTPEHQGSDEEDDGVNGNDNGGKDSSSGDEHFAELKPKRYKRWGGGNDTDTARESRGAAAGLIGSPEILAWGKGGMRSSSRHGGLGSGNGRSVKNSRLSAIMDCLRRSDRDNDVLDITLKLVSLQEDKIPSLQKPYLCCRPTLSIRQLCQYVAVEASIEADQIQLWAMKGVQKETGSSILQGCESHSSPVLDPSKYEACPLEEHQTLDELYTTFSPGQRKLILAYGNREIHT